MADDQHEGDSRGERGWGEYRRLVLAELERINRLLSETGDKIDNIRSKDIAQLRIEIAMLQVKSGVWGALGGLITGLAAVVIALLRFSGHL